MDTCRPRTFSTMPLLLALLLWAPRLGAQSSPAPPRAPKSVRGTLRSVDKGLNRVTMKTDAGKSLAWGFSPAVIAEVDKFTAGTPMIVIYRQVTPTEKRVTAVAFPGTAKTPTYVNLTGSRVVLRSSAAVGNVCAAAAAGAASESIIPVGGRAEAMEACWCCAPAGSTCTPGTRSGPGQAFLERCFE